jgi:hypothetical protein
MAQLEQHPTVKQFREREAAGELPAPLHFVESSWLRGLCLEAGADDVGFVEVEGLDASHLFDDQLERRRIRDAVSCIVSNHGDRIGSRLGRLRVLASATATARA